MIRRAMLSDMPRLIEMGQRFASSSEYAGRVEVDPEQIAHSVAAMLDNPMAVVLVSGSDATITGMLLAVLYEHPFSGKLTATELAWWVEPEARGDGVRLLRAAETWARESGAVRMQMVAPNERVATLYQRRGYEALETVYQRSL